MLRTFALVLGLSVVATSGARAWPPSDAGLPPNMQVPGMYRPLIEAMWQRSPTFRRQISRIARASYLTVSVEVAPPEMSGARASTRIEKKPDGRMVAAVQMRRGAEPTELIAHELEHIIEQLDGVDLEALALQPSSGVHRTAGSGYDTLRAIRVGERVAQEVRNRRG